MILLKLHITCFRHRPLIPITSKGVQRGRILDGMSHGESVLVGEITGCFDGNGIGHMGEAVSPKWDRQMTVAGVTCPALGFRRASNV